MTVDMAAPPDSRPSSRVTPAWFQRSGFWLAAAACAAASIYAPLLIGLVRQWFDDADAAYGCIVAVAAMVTLTQRWTRVRAIPLEGSRWGALALASAVMLYVMGTIAADVFLMRTSLIAICAAAILFVAGARHLRALAVPLLLFLIAIPLPSALVTEVTMPLQLAASRCAAALIAFTGTDVIRDGNVLTLPYITLEVAEACSGMRSMVTLLALVAVYAGTCGVRVRPTLLLLAATIPVALVGNGLRVAFTALLASRIGATAVTGIVHDATGWGAFVLMCAALAGVHMVATRAAIDRRVAA